MQQQTFNWRDALLAGVVLAIAAAGRCGYAYSCMQDLRQPPPFQVQDAETAFTLNDADITAVKPETDRDTVVESLVKSGAFAGQAPLANKEETTAHVSPGYLYLIAWLRACHGGYDPTRETLLWLQCGLGAITAVIYFLFARLAFGSASVAFLAGLLTALHPFWIVNAAEFQDGTLVSFLVACALFLGTFAAQRASPLASLLFGGSLAGMALVRAALLPFGFIACLWFLLGCRRLPRGWLCGLLAFLGFANGLAPWTVRNYQVFGEVIPVTDSLFVHLWIGNNSAATGSPQDEKTLTAVLAAESRQKLLAEQNQASRYRNLANDVWETIQGSPGGTIENRLRSGVSFVFGGNWLSRSVLSSETLRDDVPAWISDTLRVALPSMLLAMLILGLIGWRWSCGFSREANLASLAMLWIPLPYILSHAEFFSGPRLPLDGVLLCYTAFVLARILAPETAWSFLGRSASET